MLDRVEIGDVIVSSRIADFTRETALVDDVRYSVGGGPIAREAASIIANLPALKTATHEWRKAISLPILPPKSIVERSRVTAGVIASSDRLVRDPAILVQWQSQVSGIKAIDMESAGVYRVATRRDVPFVAIRGISEFVDGPRHQRWSDYASHAAAAFTAAFLRARPFAPRSRALTPKMDMLVVAPSIARNNTPFHLQRLHLTDVRGVDALEIEAA
jgi:nucleoside phosphorylase